MKHQSRLSVALLVSSIIISQFFGYSMVNALDLGDVLNKAKEITKPPSDKQNPSNDSQKTSEVQETQTEVGVTPSSSQDWSYKWMMQTGYKSGGVMQKLDIDGRFVPAEMSTSYPGFKNGDKILFKVEVLSEPALDISEATVKIVEGLGYRNNMSMYDDGKLISTVKVKLNRGATWSSFQIPFSYSGHRAQYNIYLYDMPGNLRAKCGLELKRY